MKLGSGFRKLFDRIESIRIRTQVLALVLLFGAAVLIDVLALVYLARSISLSLENIETAHARQLLAV